MGSCNCGTTGSEGKLFSYAKNVSVHRVCDEYASMQKLTLHRMKLRDGRHGRSSHYTRINIKLASSC